MTRTHIVIAVLTISVMLITAILSFFFDHYEWIQSLLGGKKLVRVWLIVFFVLLLAGVVEQQISLRRRRDRK